MVSDRQISSPCVAGRFGEPSKAWHRSKIAIHIRRSPERYAWRTANETVWARLVGTFTSMITIRTAEIRDNEAVFLLAGELAASFVIERKTFNLSYQKLLDSPDALLAVAVAGELVIGYLLAFDHVTFFANGRVA